MKPWTIIGRAKTPDGTELTLASHPSEFLLLADGESLMTSRAHHSEDVLAVLGCARARTLERPSILVSGLGMGYTLRAALDILPPHAEVLVAELVPEVVDWNRGPLAPLAGHPLNDPRVRVEVADVASVLRSHPARFDAVLLDVDNGPFAMSAAPNAGLYDRAGVALSRAALRPGGVLAVWSAGDDDAYERRLRGAGLRVDRERVKSRLSMSRGGRRHTILLAQAGP